MNLGGLGDNFYIVVLSSYSVILWSAVMSATLLYNLKSHHSVLRVDSDPSQGTHMDNRSQNRSQMPCPCLHKRLSK